MESYITPANVTFVLGVLGVIFTVFRYFKEPQTEEEKKAALLALQVNLQNESVNNRFKEIQDNFFSLLKQNQNHIHTVDTKVDVLSHTVESLAKDIVRLSTIIEERIPKK